MRVMILCVLLLTVLNGCGMMQCEMCGRDFKISDVFFNNAKYDEARERRAVKQQIVVASGYGALDPSAKNSSQQHLMAMRVSEVDAYRAMAERIRGVSISGNTKIEDFVATYDHLHSMVEAYIQNASIISQKLTREGIYETTLQLTLNADFLEHFALPTETHGEPRPYSTRQGHSDSSMKGDTVTQDAIDMSIDTGDGLQTQSTTEQHYQLEDSPST